jgi:hypothetical protein
MNKGLLLSLLLIIFGCTAMAQSLTKKELLLAASKNMDMESRRDFSDAIIKAKDKGWALSYKSGNKSSAYLMGIDAFGQPIYYISYADPVNAITINTNKLWPGGSTNLNLNGSSDSLTNKLGIWDEGLPRKTHREYVGRIYIKDSSASTNDHSTHVMGTMMSTGINALAKGMAYGIKSAFAYDWNNDASEMAAAAANGLYASNHSYGTVCGWDYNTDSSRWEYNGKYNEKEDYRFGLYDNQAQRYDSISYNAPNYLIVKSAGNSRSSNGPTKNASGVWLNNDSTYWRRNESGKWYNAGVRPDSLSSNNSYETLAADVNAKNILTIGAVYGIGAGYTRKEDVIMPSFSCWGPTDDGRIKPDLVTDGVNVYSTISTNDSSYGYLNGTSMATPSATGTAILLQELSQKKQLKPLRSATIKALLIHTASEAGLNPGPDYKFGWGLLNASEAGNTLNTALTNNNSSSSTDLVYENILQNGETKTFTLIASGKKPLKATLVWTDIKGSVNNLLNDASSKLINDLDLKISNGITTTASWVLNPTIPEAAASKGNNKVDNVEKVEMDTTLVGNTYTITVSHKNTLDRGQQAYSLVISGAGGAAYCTSTATSNAGTRIDSISLNNIQYQNKTVNQYIDNTKAIINGEPGGTLPYFIRTASADATNNARFIKIFIDYNNNSVFDSTELVATSGSLTNGDYTGSINLPSSLSIGSYYKLRVVVSETNAAANVTACGNYTAGETQDYSIKINNISNDLQISEITSPNSSTCNKDVQYVTVKISNNGGNNQSNFPVTLSVTKNGVNINTLNENFTGTLAGLDNMYFTFQKPIALEGGATYNITATVNLSTDLFKSNNSLSNTFSIVSNSNKPVGTVGLCNTNLQLNVSNPLPNANYFWYDSSSSVNPVASGINVSLSSNATNLKLTQGYQGFVGPTNNTTLGPNGGYNNFTGNFTKFSTTGPLTIETAKIYTGYPGKIKITLASFGGWINDSVYTRSLVQDITLNTMASSPVINAPTGNGATPFIEGDTGRVYYLNLNVPKAGEYILVVECVDKVTIFRNNGLGTNTYPIGPGKVFSYSGNSVTASAGNFQNFYYFFYNTQISTNECLSPSTNINTSVISKPVISQNSDSTLSSSVGSKYQWYMFDSLLTNETNQTLKATKNALYKVNTTVNGCSLLSDPKLILITAIDEAPVSEIGLRIRSLDYTQNLIKGNSFFIEFSHVQTQDISLDLLNAMGERVFHKENLINQQAPQRIDINNLNTGMYFVKIYTNKKVYVQKVYLTNN